jgi:Lrp/AsnC family transcriptional regulator, leucine-responsive regulatory protein
MKNTLDAKDLLLIDLLVANARQPLLALARGIGLSRSATQERLQRLERSGVIRGYAAQVVWPQDRPVEAWLTIRLEPGIQCHDVVPTILATPGVRLCHALAGDIDGLVRVSAKSAEEVSGMRDRLSALPGIKSITTHFVLAAHR